jgi:hypothetical protein
MNDAAARNQRSSGDPGSTEAHIISFADRRERRCRGQADSSFLDAETIWSSLLRRLLLITSYVTALTGLVIRRAFAVRSCPRAGQSYFRGFRTFVASRSAHKIPDTPTGILGTVPVRLSCIFEFFFVVPSRCGAFSTVFGRKIHFSAAFQSSDS